MRYRDPYCDCQVQYPGATRLWCEHCRTYGPLPGSMADPEWETRQNDPIVLREAAATLADDLSQRGLAGSLLVEADRLDQEDSAS